VGASVAEEVWKLLWDLFLVFCFFWAFLLLLEGKTELGVLLLIFFSIEKVNMRLDRLRAAVKKLVKHAEASEKGEER